MYSFKCILIAIGVFIYGALASAEFTVTEILVLPWGDGPNELEIWEPYREYSDGPEIDTVGHLEPGGGPNNVFVDRDENCYFSSYEIGYLKGFNTNGEVIVNYSEGKTQFHWEFFRGMFNGFYVDSLGRIFCNGNEMRGAYVAVADRNNNLLDKLNPVGIESGVPCKIATRGSDDVFIFDSWDHGYYTYANGQFKPGGSYGWLAKDGYYYWGKPANSSSILLLRYANPDTSGRPATIDTLHISFEFNNLEAGGLYMLDDSLNLYIDYKDSSGVHDGIRVYDQTLKLIDEIQYLPRQENRYLWDTPYPFIRHDGNVYEFHCRDDGLHVFRWSRK
jgi:hypothetical protein